MGRADVLAQLATEVRGWQTDQEGFDAVVADLAGLNRTDWRCLDILGTAGPMTAGQLADALRLTTGALTSAVDRLERMGLVRRVRDDRDRRRVHVELTDEAALQAAPVFGPYLTDVAASLEPFDAEELATIVRFIRGQRAVLRDHAARVREMRQAARSPRA